MFIFPNEIQDTPEYQQKCGNKGRNLGFLVNCNIHTPPFVILDSDICSRYESDSNVLAQYKAKLSEIDIINQLKYNRLYIDQYHNSSDSHNDKIFHTVSIRSSGLISMPGLMQTYLNIGLTRDLFQRVPTATSSVYCNFLHHYIKNLLIILEKLDSSLNASSAALASEYQRLSSALQDGSHINQFFNLKNNIEQAIDELSDATNYAVLDSYVDQVLFFIDLVLRSSKSEHIESYRSLHNITKPNNIAVIIQEMVYGDISGATGVCFSRHPVSGENEIYIEAIFEAQGHDIVSGTKTPQALHQIDQSKYPWIIELKQIANTLERNRKFPQDIEFTVFNGTLYILQTRDAKFTDIARAKILLDLHQESIISTSQVLDYIKTINLESLTDDTTEIQQDDLILARGTPSGTGVLKCVIAISDEYIEANHTSKPLCLVRSYTSVDNYDAMQKCKVILTKIGGSTSHAAVIARSLGKPAICGLSDMYIHTGATSALDAKDNYIMLGGHKLYEGEEIIVDSAKGLVLDKSVNIVSNFHADRLKDFILSSYNDLSNIGSHAGNNKSLKVVLNADTAEEIKKGINLGVNKVGLCRTEHMLVDSDLLLCFRKYILIQYMLKSSANLQLSHIGLNNEDVIRSFKTLETQYSKDLCQGYTAKFLELIECKIDLCVRLLDPPLHEFFNHVPEILYESLINDICKALEAQCCTDKNIFGNSAAASYSALDQAYQLGGKNTVLSDVHNLLHSLIQNTILDLHEINPMLGNRGARLGIAMPDLYRIQVRALLGALSHSNNQHQIGITVPLITSVEEMQCIVKLIQHELDQHPQLKPIIKIGAMIETVISCYISADLAKICDYFSFGTNDLTQTALSISRDDMPKVSEQYYELWGINPFVELEPKCVIPLMAYSINEARRIKPRFPVSICGEQASSTISIILCLKFGINEISVSNDRVLNAKRHIISCN